MAKSNAPASREILEAALRGLELQRDKLEEQMAQVRSMLGRRVGRPPKSSGIDLAAAARAGKPTRQLSDEARKRIAAAQKKRWAAFRKSAAKKS
jgi:hypothetical protein